MKNVFKTWNSYLSESHSKEDEEELKKISDELKGAVKAHQSQADRIDKILDSTDDDELEKVVDERKGGRRGISPMYRMATGGGGAYSPSDDSVVDFLSDMVKDKIEDYRKKKKEKEARINPELTDKYMKKAGILHPDEEVPGEEEERRLARFRSSNKAKLDRLMGRKVKIAGIDEDLEEGKKKNCGCGQDPCITYGIQEVKGGDKEDGEYQDTVDDSFDDALEEKKKKKKKKKGGKKDACYHKVKSRYDVWPSAYASGALVKCRKVGAKNWGNKSKKKNESFNIFGDIMMEEILTALINEEGLKDWFDDADGDGQKGWEQIGGKYDGKPCAKQPGQKTKPKCASPEKAASMSKKEKDNAAKRKRAKDPNPNRKGKAKNVNTDPKKESIEMNRQEQLKQAVLEELSEYVYYHITDATYDDGTLAEDIDFWDDVLEEAEYQGRKVTLNKPMKGDVKKSKVYVKNAKGNVVKVNFGDKKMKIKKSNPKRRKSFRARHNCDNPGPKWKARYWSCKAW